jgi:hypothetical protein
VPKVKKSASKEVKSVKKVENVPSVLPIPEKTQAEKIWDSIKDKPIEMFALPGQTPSKYCEPIKVEPTKLYLTFKVAVVLPALEEAFKNVYNVDLMDKYIVISPKVKTTNEIIVTRTMIGE